MLALDIGTIGYLFSVAAYVALAIVLLIGWRDRKLHGALLITVALTSLLWAAVLAWQGTFSTQSDQLVLITEFLRDSAWVAFLWGILRKGGAGSKAMPRAIDAVAVIAVGLVLGSLVLITFPEQLIGETTLSTILLLSKIGLILAVLILVEHLFRYTGAQRRWAIKYLCLAIVGVYVFDFYKYVEALLFQDIDIARWEARGYIHALVVPLIAVSAARNPQWHLDVYVSRRLVFHSTVIVASGSYLIVMAAAGFYLRRYGGDWGHVSQVVLVFAAVLFLMIVALSTQVRAKLKVFISKHFFNYRYDYREEWLRMTRTLVSGSTEERLPIRAIRAIADILESPGGQLWLKQSNGRLLPVERWNSSESLEISQTDSESLIRFLLDTEWVIELEEYREHRDRYRDLVLSAELLAADKFWLIVPLLHDRELIGFILLIPSRATKTINWEDRDILKVAAREVAGYLAQSETLRALTEARQFEGFNRLSAYMIHDLKNLIAQLSLVISNAQRHRANPEFLQDVIGTVENSVARMTKLLEQLRTGAVPRQLEMVDLAQVTSQAVEMRSVTEPRPRLVLGDGQVMLEADRDRLLAIVKHLIQNAQEATAVNGSVNVRVWRENTRGYVAIEDNGCGMSEEFIRERLFRPFDTTKGLTGMGIGAFEAREMFRALGGDIVVTSEPDRGTQLLCSVSLSEAAVEQPAVSDEVTS